jgi:hypothetical protein
VEKKFATGLAATFLVATLYIIYVDWPFYFQPTDYIPPGIAFAVGLGALVYSIYAFWKPDLD